jgi:hypothetical protein
MWKKSEPNCVLSKISKPERERKLQIKIKVGEKDEEN